ncbi:MAG TPA: helix-turn-helix domain-containing protein [Actinophytocola sp.]|jgi:AcrR family transcriptional regulator|nr:helix-turn-helix domain-containing protein [Actinophytocola sp.]
MGEGVKGRRYDNTRRQAQTRATKAAVITAAQDLFVQRGYPAATIDAIAEAASVPVATVYRLFGSKRGILSAVLDVAFGGDDQPIAFHERPAVRAALADPDPGRLLDAFSHLARELLDRSASIQHVLVSAATVDPEAADLLATARSQRLLGQSRVIQALADRRALREGLTVAQGADIFYTLVSPEVHRILTIERRWTPSAYEIWLTATLRATFLAIPPDA